MTQMHRKPVLSNKTSDSETVTSQASDLRIRVAELESHSADVVIRAVCMVAEGT